MEGTVPKTNFQNQKTSFFSLDPLLLSDVNDPDANFLNDKLQDIDSPYLSLGEFQNFLKYYIMVFGI